MLRISSFLAVFLFSTVLPWWLVLPVWAVHAFFFGGPELIILGVLLDGYGGYAGLFHVFYTTAAAALCAAAAVLRPRLARFEGSTVFR